MSDEADTPEIPKATATLATAAPGEPAPAPSSLVWVRRGAFFAVLVLGWLFILSQNQFRITPPVVFVCLALLAIVASVYTLWRTGVVAVADEDDGDDSTWGRPLGARGELEREKKALLKAIKEAEFDREMGKLSKSDAEEMILIYRVRAIEVIKEIDKLDEGAAGTVREQIEREVKARLEIEAKTKKAAADARTEPKVGGKPRPTSAKASAEAPSAAPPSAAPPSAAPPSAAPPPADTTEPAVATDAEPIEPATGAAQPAKEATR